MVGAGSLKPESIPIIEMVIGNMDEWQIGNDIQIGKTKYFENAIGKFKIS